MQLRVAMSVVPSIGESASASDASVDVVAAAPANSEENALMLLAQSLGSGAQKAHVREALFIPQHLLADVDLLYGVGIRVFLWLWLFCCI